MNSSFAIAHQEPSSPSDELTILHVSESFAGGVKTALLQYIQSTPEFHHIILGNTRGEELTAEQRTYNIVPMVQGQFARVKQLQRVIEDTSPQVIHAHSSFGGVYARVHRTGIPLIYTPHCFAFERTDLSPVKRAAIHLIEKNLARRTSIIAGCSEREADLAHSFGSCEAMAIPNVGRYANLLTPSGSSRIHHDGTHNALRFGFVGRAVPQKGVDFALDLCAAFRQSSAASAEFVWIGDGPQQYVDALRSAGVEVTGWLNKERVLAELSRLQCYLHTAAWEGFPMAILEASQLGLPVIARRIPALSHMPVEYLANTPAGAALIMMRTLESASSREACTDAWAEALSEHTRPHQREALLNLYNHVSEGSIDDARMDDSQADWSFHRVEL